MFRKMSSGRRRQYVTEILRYRTVGIKGSSGVVPWNLGGGKVHMICTRALRIVLGTSLSYIYSCTDGIFKCR